MSNLVGPVWRRAVVRPSIPAVVSQHVENAAHLRRLRTLLVRAPHLGLLQLRRLDERLAAHLDGIAVAGSEGREFVQRALARPRVGEIFVAATRAIDDRDEGWLDKLLTITQALPASRAGLLSAFGWSSAAKLRGLIPGLLNSADEWHQTVGFAACAMHGAHPGVALEHALAHRDADLRRIALKFVGQHGRLDLLPACLAALDDERWALEAASSAVLLGDRADAVATLISLSAKTAVAEPIRQSALLRVLKVSSPERGRAILSPLVNNPADARLVLLGVAELGDPRYVSWLIKQMDDKGSARLAAAAFSTMTGLELSASNLASKPPADFDLLPNDDRNDSDVAMDEDAGLPWPDVSKIASWWHAHGERFVPGNRYFLGEPLNPAKCAEGLQGGFQKHRMDAAQFLTLLAPGTPLFDVAAPAWRQDRNLMGRA